MNPLNLFLVAVVLLASWSPSSAAADSVKVPRWQPHDFAFTAKERVENPFAVSFLATVKGPDGVTLILPGFYDGNETWKIRVAPTVEGDWSLVTQSDLKELDGQSVTFTGVRKANKRMHGPLRVDPEHPHHFLFADGSRFYLQAYECDWLWALDMADDSVPTVNSFLNKIGSFGFNYVILNAYAQDTDWRQGRTGDDDYGPPALHAWEGTNDKPDHSRLNVAYWQHYDRVIAALNERGMQAHIFAKVYNKHVNWPARNSPEEDRYFRYLISRYSAYPNVIWDFSKESYNEKDKDYLKGKLRFIRANDPYHRLLTVHDDDGPYNRGEYDDLLDFQTDQEHSNIHNTVVKERARKQWPVANMETAYEHGPGGMMDKTYGVVQTPEETLRQAWEVAMGGGYMAYYYTYTAWDVVRPQDTPPGYAYFKRFGDFWRSTGYWKLEPADQRVSKGWCLANPEGEYVVFLNKAQTFTLTVDGAQKPLKAVWYNPQTGERTVAARSVKGTMSFTPATEWGQAPVVLHVTPR